MSAASFEMLQNTVNQHETWRVKTKKVLKDHGVAIDKLQLEMASLSVKVKEVEQFGQETRVIGHDYQKKQAEENAKIWQELKRKKDK